MIFVKGEGIHMEFKELIKERRSVRAYQEGKSISDDVIREIIEDALLAPSWKNYETSRFYVANTPERIEKVRACMPSFNQKSTANASYIITTYVKDTSGFTAGNPDNELGNKWGAYDLGLSNAYLILAAKDRGLDTLILGLRDSVELRKAFDIPKTEQIAAIIAIGYGAKEPVLGARKSIDEVAHF